jgi:hypothetical protein
MACTLCYVTGGAKDNYYDDTTRTLWNSASGCDTAKVALSCLNNNTRQSGCQACTGCPYTGVALGAVSCYTDFLCTSPCSVVPELGENGLLTTSQLKGGDALIWSGALLAVLSLSFLFLKKKTKP